MAKGALRADGRWVRTRGVVAWSQALADTICKRMAKGELLYRICLEPGMPTPQSVGRWMRARPGFGEALTAARLAGGRMTRGGGVSTYSPDVGEAIYERLCEGESLTAIGADPTMPSLSTIYFWRRRIDAFEEMVRRGRQVQAERFCDLGWDLARAATPETAYLTHVRLGQLRWMAGVMAPRVFRLKPVEPEGAREQRTVLFRHFEVEVDGETGQRRVVAYCPNPETGEVEREDAPGWTPPPGAVRLPGGG